MLQALGYTVRLRAERTSDALRQIPVDGMFVGVESALLNISPVIEHSHIAASKYRGAQHEPGLQPAYRKAPRRGGLPAQK
jgi:hypothetical protein